MQKIKLSLNPEDSENKEVFKDDIFDKKEICRFLILQNQEEVEKIDLEFS